MRERSLLKLFVILNAALAGAFVIYLLLTTSRQPKVEQATFPTPARTNVVWRTNLVAAASNAPASAAGATNPAALAAGSTTNAPALKAVFAGRHFTWQDVESPPYVAYLNSLRAVGCPEERVRAIVMADIDELFAQKRLKEAVANDPQWWKTEPDLNIANVLAEKGRTLEAQRQALIEKLLGAEAGEKEKGESVFWSNVQLTGPVLGSLPPDKHAAVQEVCGRSIERHQSAIWAQFNEGQPLNQADLAKLREQTRVDLRKMLTPEELEEFLLRYSHNAHQLRYELRGLDPTPEEFRKIFRAIDPIDHALQLEFGSADALSPQQRERYQRQRDEAIRGALQPERYEAFLVTKDPLYRTAQMTAMQYGAPTKAIMPLYQMAKASETKRQRILTDNSLTPQQKNAALQALTIEQQQNVQRIVIEAAMQRQAN